MSAFGSPWGEIDETRQGAPVIVDSNGWGWFALLFLLALPVLMIGSASFQICEWIKGHAIVSLLLYTGFFALLGIFLYVRPGTRHRMLGILASVLTSVPLLLTLVLYFVPYATSQVSSFDIGMACLSSVGLLGAGMALVFCVASLLRNGARHLAIAALFAAAGIGVSWLALSYGSALVTIDSLHAFYEL